MGTMAQKAARQPKACPERGAGGNAEDVGEGEAGEHQGDGLRALVAGNEVRRDDAADAEERAVAERGEHAGGEEQVVRRRDGAGEVAQREDAHQQQQGQLALQPRGGDGDQRSADGDRERVAGDQDAGLGDADLEVVGEVGEQPHDDELGGADAEGGDGECEQRSAAEDAGAALILGKC